MIKKFSHYNESLYSNSDFEIGDKVICNGHMDDIDFNGEIGIIDVIYLKYTLPFAGVKFSTNFSPFLRESHGQYYYDVYFHLLTHFDPMEVEKRRIRQ